MTEYTYTGTFDFQGLVKEIAAAGLSIVGAAETGTTFTVEASLTAPQKTTLDGVVLAHDFDGLEAHKSVRRSNVKGRTEDLLGEGVIVNATLVGTTDDRLEYYRGWHAAVSDRAALMPVSIRGRNYVMYTITVLSDATDLVEAVEDRQKSLYDGEKTLLDAIDIAATQAALDAVTDARS